ncbi:unnamed protein product [Prorocentrum cordatum]|uniref:Uncharacterized protein n=1 Tax=Prorocentrum cordatum TaxID=2364126 RepID=A0ABN9RM41_9DINO|nr:unnamed protein product [Polarella glacialis]
MHMLRFIRCTAFLRKFKDLEKQSEATFKAHYPRVYEDMLAELFNNGFSYPSRAQLYAARPRLDMAVMSIERRMLSVGPWSRPRVGRRTIHLYTDSSPNSGEEIMGSLCDIFIPGASVLGHLLPGVCLGHGYQGAMDKAFALLWQLWLIAGPRMETLEHVLEDCLSITTDMGHERLIADLGNCLTVFASKLGLQVSAMFASYSRLLEFCVAVPDWHHLISGCLKASLQALEEWPNILNTLRAHCRFFRSDSYREALVVWLKTNGHGDFSKLLRYFSASFAKWRFETFLDVVVSLSRLRNICSFFRPHMLGALQDAQDFNEVLKHKGNSHFWRWVSGFTMMAKPIDRFRTWAAACPHPAHQEALMKGKSVKCEMLGRRLHEASKRVHDLRTELTRTAETLVVGDVGGDEAVFSDLTFCLRRFLPEFKEKFGWVDMMPYTFANATDQAVAQSMIQQWEVIPRRDHHRMTVLLMDEFEQDIRRIADEGSGGDVPSRLEEQVEAFRRIPLSSQVAEGYHRSTKLGKTRGGVSRLPWLLSSNRIWQNLDVVAMLEDCPEGEACLDCEFRHATRVLQTKSKLFLKRVKQPLRQCIQRVYRLGEFNHFDWAEIMTGDAAAAAIAIAGIEDGADAGVGPPVGDGGAGDGGDGLPPSPGRDAALVEPHGGPPLPADQGASLKKSYLDAVIHPRCFYSVAVPDNDDPFVFEVLKVVTRPWLTVNPIRAQVRKPIFELAIQTYAFWGPDRGAGAIIYPDGDGLRTDLVATAPWANLMEELYAWEVARNHDMPGCLDLKACSLARPTMALADSQCPPLVIMKELNRRGFVMSDTLVVHKSEGAPLTEYSIRKVSSRREYLQCLLSWDTLVGQGLAEMRSDAPIDYYKNLLRGSIVPPGLSAKMYRRILQGEQIEDVIAELDLPEAVEDGDAIAPGGGPEPAALEDGSESGGPIGDELVFELLIEFQQLELEYL